MEATNPWLTIILALIGSFGGAPLFKFLAARAKGSAAVRRSEREDFERDKAELRKAREAFEAEQRKRAQSDRLELSSLRAAFNEVVETNGRLQGMLARADEELEDLRAEIAALRKVNG